MRLQAAAVMGRSLIVRAQRTVVRPRSGCSCRTSSTGSTGYSTGELLAWAALVSLTVIAARFVWVFAASAASRTWSAAFTAPSRRPPWRDSARHRLGGMRGAVSLAAALAVPLDDRRREPRSPTATSSSSSTFSVILATLVLQGLSLPAVIRMLGVGGRERRRGARRREGAHPGGRGRARAAGGAVRRGLGARRHGGARCAGCYGFRASRFAARLDDDADGAHRGAIAGATSGYGESCSRQSAPRSSSSADGGAISDDVMRRVQRDLDLEEARLDV